MSSFTVPCDMASSTQASDLTTIQQELLDERDRLKNQLAYYKSAVDALTLQNERYAEMLQTGVVTLANQSPASKTPDVHWVAGNFLYRPSVDHYLKDSIDAYQGNSAQRAIAFLTLKINTTLLTDPQRVNAQLLLAAMMRASATNRDSEQTVEKALAIADDALAIAEKMRDHAWVCKAHFHRGLCYLHLNRFADAKWSLILASGAPEYSELAALQCEHIQLILDGLTGDRSRMHLESFMHENSDS
ncbi:MAG: hypothetical protein HETSPECPRED_003157 [Heterodermia speciosa]|uniref:Uncharacterized protein n=1 Tax=Heterodermia speciosa TaxID=116794 RepID=A0A8H3F6Y3_9LECA|nr:MAG: hypothetical protein HETSPECPRED_003157 [Heterodermia speciosa]